MLTAKLEEQAKEIAELKRQRSAPTSSHNDNQQGKKPLFTVAPFCLKYIGESMRRNGITWWWCKGNHWSNGILYNGMYCDHTTAEHDEWRKHKDTVKNAKRFKSEGEAVIKIVQGPVDNPSSAGKKPNSDTANMKLGLSDTMKAALVTHCGLTPSQIEDMEEKYN